MKISLITVCYNSAATIRGAMESVAAQKRDGGLEVEYIVVDGGSTDGTVEHIKDFAARLQSVEPSNVKPQTSNVKPQTSNVNPQPSNLKRQTSTLKRQTLSIRWISERDRGMYDALNKGIGMATGDVIGILNADDRLEDGRVLSDMVKVFECCECSESCECSSEKSGLDAIYGDVRFVRGEGKETARYYSSRPWRPWMHNWGYMPAHPTVYVRREVFEKFGGYKLGYDISADFEWMVRILCRAKIRAKYVPRCMVTMRLGGKSTAGLRAMLRLNRENVRANRENGYFCCLPMMLPKYLYKIWGYVFRSH